MSVGMHVVTDERHVHNKMIEQTKEIRGARSHQAMRFGTNFRITTPEHQQCNSVAKTSDVVYALKSWPAT
jgi:hypothetical protein